MARKKSTSEAILCKSICQHPFRWHTQSHWFLAVFFLLGLSGCQRFPGGQAMRQYQMESDRLLSEFRAQKKRAEDLEVRNGQLEQRLAESEKMLARSLGGSSARSTAGSSSRGGNDAKLMIGDVRGDRNALGSLSEFNSSRSSPRGTTAIQRGGLPDSEPPTSGRLASGNRSDPISLGNGQRDLRGDPKSDAQWRPVSRGQ